ncbi:MULTISPECIES: NHLP leader peptide family RiPP precursor [Microvirgula]|uniref:NHLP leader peptide family natural product n=1 Tax=Microvirgula aerodenitrificans TaxID=57480 RepID=A0A2S0PEI6_9NEIS|nr:MULTISPECIES: NHLP leader peptide family RiPP precursor [Microvirgula]AVY95799.1 NHLP leader peptide family natural product precursor [Microvirgula aerodenitrificans]RAS15730.1 putative ribosomally synthesized peptide [Microvirgula sp. AG722]
MTTTTPASTQVPQTRRDLETHIITKAWKDPEYKAQLLKDPKAALQDALKSIDPSLSLPDSLQVQVHEENANLFHLVLPRNPSEISLAEVVGDNLEAVAPQTIAVVLVAVVGAAAAAVVTYLGAANVVGAANGTVTANAVANTNAVA